LNLEEQSSMQRCSLMAIEWLEPTKKCLKKKSQSKRKKPI